MSKVYANPFQWGHPVSGSHYIARPEAQENIATAMEKQLHLIITGHRGTGKTSLISHVLSKSTQASAYMNLNMVVCRRDLIDLLLESMGKRFPELASQIKNLGLSEGETALAPVFDFIYDMVKQSNQKFTFVWDEFHYLAKLKDDIITELRENLRDRRGITHIFISHREDIMREIFEDHANPFFYHREHLYLHGIDQKVFEKFLTQRFRRMGLSDFDLAGTLLDFTESQPQLTQQFAHSLAQLWLQGTSTRLMAQALKKILTEQRSYFNILWDSFGLNERRLFLGLAQGYSRPTELAFIKQFELSATSTAHNTVLKLLRDGWLVNRDEGYHIYDPLFLNWLKQKRGIA